jgi:hypothetical protein
MTLNLKADLDEREWQRYFHLALEFVGEQKPQPIFSHLFSPSSVEGRGAVEWVENHVAKRIAAGRLATMMVAAEEFDRIGLRLSTNPCHFMEQVAAADFSRWMEYTYYGEDLKAERSHLKKELNELKASC